ncbi:MAG: SLC13 family permease [Succinivibrionaceae bacterium]
MRVTIYKIAFIIVTCIVFGLLPFIFSQTLDLTINQHILLIIFVFGAMCWLLEPVPVYATSLIIMCSLCILISDSAIFPLREYSIEQDPKHILSFKSILSSFSSPIIILFLGGFALAIGATKYKLDANLARILLKPFGQNPRMVMLGIMAITSVFAMFMSNTATTVMMLAMVAPVLTLVDKTDKGIKALVLSVPFAANIGGIATPIGTPPNAIALSYLTGEKSISFMTWMLYALPLAIICVFFSWFILNILFPFKEKTISINITGKFTTSWRAIVSYLGFGITILLWMTERWHGINSYVVALVPLLLYTCTGIIKVQDIKTMNWDVIWLVAGGIALGDALGSTELAKVLANIVDYSQYNNFVLVAIICFIGWIASNFISNTATANLILPIAIAVLSNVQLEKGYNISTIMMITAITLSFGMSLPISTPPNALAYATGYIKNSDMLKAGAIISVVCLLLALSFLYLISLLNQ